MMRTRTKWITVAVLAIFCLICAGVRLFDDGAKVTSENLEAVVELNGKTMGGVVSKMPDNSSRILFDSILGVKLKGYRSYPDVYETLSALKTNEIQVAWFADVTADYLARTEKGIRKLEIPKASEDRLEFGMALSAKNQALKDDLNGALRALKGNGTLESLVSTYIEAEEIKPMYAKDFEKISGTNGTIYVGVTGALPPIDMVDFDQKPYGFSVALMHEIGKILGKEIRYVYLQNDTSFSMLMGGKVDVLFSYGTSKNTVDTKKTYCMTDGYYTMNQYAYLVLE
ncbi:transporter substrate-binding domain-containing protein [Lachnoclostridium sp.]|uniref:transporter substrate-binding domain-containing protein n=1 Tax=Lachnoclostridium sp. TaxID=2028282 RepID=UPI0028A13295|nr:transporter substrate-binding domain-containing protein [Lachnoclostridium sp.]